MARGGDAKEGTDDDQKYGGRRRALRRGKKRENREMEGRGEDEERREGMEE